MHKVQVVIPLYNESKNLPELWQRICGAFEGLNKSWSLLFVNDGSTDETAAKLDRLAEENSHVRVIHLSRNFGHQGALTAGVDHAEGDAIILMDGDLQDRPEAIPDLIAAWQNGSDVVYAERKQRKERLRVLFKLFYRLQSQVSGVRMPTDAGIFGLLDHKVVEVIRSMPEHNRYFPGLRAFAGFKQTGIVVDRDERLEGEAKVGLKGLLSLAMDAFFSFSYLPIRIVTLLGLIVASASFGYLMLVLYYKLFTNEAISGWASNLAATLMLGGVQLVMLGIVGEYIARIYEETKQRPQYIIGKKINFQ